MFIFFLWPHCVSLYCTLLLIIDKYCFLNAALNIINQSEASLIDKGMRSLIASMALRFAMFMAGTPMTRFFH